MARQYHNQIFDRSVFQEEIVTWLVGKYSFFIQAFEEDYGHIYSDGYSLCDQ
jgi:hypothetical protein